MAAVIRKPVYNANNNTLTFSGLNSLGSGSTVFSSAIDNTTNLDADRPVSGKFVTAAASVSATGTISVIIAASADGGTTYATNVADCKLLAVLTANSNSLTVVLDPASIAALYGGILPAFYKIGVVNNTGQSLASSGNSMFDARQQEEMV